MIAIYGASGHTGELVARELISRGQDPLLLARSPERLEAVVSRLGKPMTCQTVAADDQARLRERLSRTDVVINCAGPFSQTARPIARAAIDAEISYVDVTAEPPVMKELAETLHAPAEEAGVALVSGAGFYFALGDCLAGLLAPASGPFSRITVAYLVDHWRMTRASRETAMALMQQPRLVYDSGRLAEGPQGRLVTHFDFPPPHGHQEVIAYPGGEVLTIPAHVPVEGVRVLMTTRTFGPQTFASDDIDPEERAQSSFVIVVEAESQAATERVWLAGKDVYRVGAVTAGEAAIRLTNSPKAAFRGPLAPAQVLDARKFIKRLVELDLVSESRLGRGDRTEHGNQSTGSWVA